MCKWKEGVRRAAFKCVYDYVRGNSCTLKVEGDS